MKNKKISALPIIIGILLLVIGGFVTYIVCTESKKSTPNNFKYEIIYEDMQIPGSKYEIKINKNVVNVKTTNYCSYIDCSPTTEEENYVYSNKNAIQLMNFIKENFGLDKKKIEVHKSSLSNYQLKIITDIIWGEKHFELDIEPYEYLLLYEENELTSYYTYFKKNNTILVKRVNGSEYNDEIYITTYKINFNNNNKKILFDYIKSQDLDEDNILYKNLPLYKNEKNIIKAIIENEENYLTNYDKDPKLLYVINYDGINCPTPELRLYDDNTYELYDTFSTSGNVTPKVGTYNYDIDKIIKNSSSNSSSNYNSEAGPFIITDKDGKKYTIFNNDELMNFFKSIDVSITRCTTQESRKKLLFSVESHLLKCPSPILKVYNDNTYELYDYISVNSDEDNIVPPKTGKYDYDVDKIMDRIESFENKDDFNLILTESDETIHYLKDYKPLEEFLKSIDVDLHRCA